VQSGHCDPNVYQREHVAMSYLIARICLQRSLRSHRLCSCDQGRTQETGRRRDRIYWKTRAGAVLKMGWTAPGGIDVPKCGL